MATHSTPFGAGHAVGPVHASGAGILQCIAPLGRVLFALIFLVSVPHHFASTALVYARQHGVPYPEIAVPISGVLALIGGLSVALGFRAKMGAWLLVLFLVPVTLWMHAFWNETDATAQQMQMVNFLKNVGLVGGALLIAYFGAGPISIDEWSSRDG